MKTDRSFENRGRKVRKMATGFKEKLAFFEGLSGYLLVSECCEQDTIRCNEWKSGMYV